MPPVSEKITSFLALLAALYSHGAFGIGCPNCANWWNQLATKYEVVLSKAAQMEQLRVQIQNYNRAISEGALLENLATAVPGFDEFVLAHKLLYQTTGGITDIKNYTDLIDDSYENFGLLLDGEHYAAVYEDFRESQKRQSQLGWRQLVNNSEGLVDLSKAREQVTGNFKKSKTEKQIWQSIAEQLNVQLAYLEKIAGILQTQHKRYLEADDQLEKRRLLEESLEARSKQIHTRGLEASGWGVRPGEEFKDENRSGR